MKYASLVVCLFLSLNVFSQQGYFVSGRVVDAATNTPLQGASVYAQNTTLGTATDADGNFRLGLPSGGYDLAVSFTGKQTEGRRVTASDANEPLNFSLKDKEKELADVTVVASTEVPDGYKVYGDFFRDNFLGKTANAQQASILNPNVLKFYFSKRKNRLKVMASEPLMIENPALGYSIKYDLDSFVYNYAANTSLYSGFPLFTEMALADSAQLLRWQAARRAAYNGSPLHFMRSLYNQRLKAEGFEVSYIVKMSDENEQEVKVGNPYSALHMTKDDSLGLASIKPLHQQFGVLFYKEAPDVAYASAFPEEPKDFQFSTITLPANGVLNIEQNGYYYDQYDAIINGYWNWTKLGDMLPYDYIAP